MNSHNDHLDPLTNVKFVLGDAPRYTIRLGKEVMEELNSKLERHSTGDVIVLGISISIYTELLAHVIDSLGINASLIGSYNSLLAHLSKKGFEVTDEIAVLPSIDLCRFCFPRGSPACHRFLIDQILTPRRYSLSLSSRILFRIYTFIAEHTKRATFLYPGVYIRIIKK